MTNLERAQQLVTLDGDGIKLCGYNFTSTLGQSAQRQGVLASIHRKIAAAMDEAAAQGGGAAAAASAAAAVVVEADPVMKTRESLVAHLGELFAGLSGDVQISVSSARSAVERFILETDLDKPASAPAAVPVAAAA